MIRDIQAHGGDGEPVPRQVAGGTEAVLRAGEVAEGGDWEPFVEDEGAELGVEVGPVGDGSVLGDTRVFASGFDGLGDFVLFFFFVFLPVVPFFYACSCGCEERGVLVEDGDGSFADAIVSKLFDGLVPVVDEEGGGDVAPAFVGELGGAF